MCDYKSETSQMVKSMVHGKPSRRNNEGQSMYDIFVWADSAPKQNRDKLNSDYYRLQNKKQIQNQQQDCNCNYAHQLIHNQNIKHQNQRQQNNQECKQQFTKTRNSLRPHQIKNQLYMYDQVHLKRNRSQQCKKPRSQIKNQKHEVNIEKPKLNQLNAKDKEIIQRRKRKIKQFRQITRDLPNSAFTTYYGKPAFQAYGRCNSSYNLKTHNVMPHMGDNHPKEKQTYEGALLNAHKVKVQDHLPRKPLAQQTFQTNKHLSRKEKIQSIPLQKPDLVNHIRFSEATPKSNRKQPVPSHRDINYIPKRSQKQKKLRKHQKINTEVNFDDRLKYMNTRNNLLTLLEEKKMKDSKLAYKVTQCYPDQAVKLVQSKRNAEILDQQSERPAGVVRQKSQPAEMVIYRRN